MGKNGKSFLQRMRFKYKLAILNENTLEEIWRIRLSKMSVFLFCFFIAVVYFFLIAILIVKTPLRGFLPGYTENINLKNQLMLDAMVVDSLSNQMQTQTQYLNSIRMVIGGNVKIDSTMTKDSLVAVTAEGMKDATEKELAYRDAFEAEEMVVANNVVSNLTENKNYLMQTPAKGRVLEPFNQRQKLYGTSVSVEQNSSVSCVLDGMVISDDYSVHNFYVLTVQHSDNMISIYKTRQPFMKKVGDRVHAGEILTTFRSGADSYLEFQLWKDGVAMDPQSFVTF